MNTLLLTVSKTGGALIRPKICVIGTWLAEMGFEPDSLVMAIPKQDGMTFTLCDENIKKYSDLVKSTKEQKGKLMQIILMSHKGKKSPTLITTGNYIRSGGLEIGDNIVVRYEYGIIKIKKLDFVRLGLTEHSHTKIAVVGKSKRKQAHNHVPTIRLTGDWLAKIGFEKDGLVTAFSEPNTIIFQSQDDGIGKYSTLVKYARENKMRLIQVSQISNRIKQVPSIFLTGSCLEHADFQINDVFVAEYEQGLIKLKKINFDTLGF